MERLRNYLSTLEEAYMISTKRGNTEDSTFLLGKIQGVKTAITLFQEQDSTVPAKLVA